MANKDHPWGKPLAPYVELLDSLLAGQLDASGFCEQYQDLYHANSFPMPGPVSGILGRLYFDTDECEPNDDWRDDNDISPDELIAKAREYLDELREYRYLL